MREIIKKNHAAFEYNREKISEIHDLCSVLFENFDISFVGYLKQFEDSSYLAISSNLTWQSCFLQKVCDNGVNFQTAVDTTPTKGLFIYIWPCTQNDGTFTKLYEHNIWNGMSIYQRGKDYIESWSFATQCTSNQVHLLTANYPDIFTNFIAHANLKHKELLSCEDKTKLGRFLGDVNLNSPCKSLINTKKFEDFESRILPQRGIIDPADNYITLSKREYQCLSFLSKGYTAKGIAIELEISPRTVESYLQEIKRKTGYNYKLDLVQAFVNRSF